MSKLKNNIFEYLFERKLNKEIKSNFDINNYISFKNENGIDAWGKSYNDLFNSIISQIKNCQASKEQEFEIETFKWYAGYVGEKINYFLREGYKNSIDFIYEDRIITLTKAISKFKLNDNLVVIRRFPNRHFNSKLKKGDIFKEKGFLSTSLNLSYRLDEDGRYRPIKKEVLILLKVPKNTEACYVEQISGRKEFELIIQRDKLIKIEKNLKILDNRIVIGEIIK